MDSKNEEAAVLTPQDLQPQLVLRTFFRGRKSCGLHQVVCVLLPLLFYLHLVFFIFLTSYTYLALNYFGAILYYYHLSVFLWGCYFIFFIGASVTL